MVKYENGKIYRLVCNITGLQYIGSTCSTLSHRKKGHKDNYAEHLKGKKTYMTSYKIIENGNYDIVLIENYPCKDKNELLSRERYYIETMECVNKIIPNRSDEEKKNARLERDKNYYWKNKETRNLQAKEWREKNKDDYAEKKRNYYLQNREKILERQKQRRNNI